MMRASRPSFARKDVLSFAVNGKIIQLRKHEIDAKQTLLEFLRTRLRRHTGTKLVCGEGGCGACTVQVSRAEFSDNKNSSATAAEKTVKHRTVNACLMPLCAADGCHITTIEGVGSSRNPHPVQKQLSEAHGSQCGFCSPGMVMSIVNELENNAAPTEHSMEECLAGNLCRCTGYRPILDAAKCFAATEEQDKQATTRRGENGQDAQGDADIVVSTTRSKILKTKVTRPKKLDVSLPDSIAAAGEEALEIEVVERDNNDVVHGTSSWFRPTTLQDLAQLIVKYPRGSAGGFTEINILKKARAHHSFVSGAAVPELNVMSLDSKTGHLEIGASVSLTRVVEFADAQSSSSSNRSAHHHHLRVLMTMRRMLQWFASKQIRNVATIGGNICNASPISDLCPILVAAGASFKLYSAVGGFRDVAAKDFFVGYRKTLRKDDEVLVSVSIPPAKENQYFQCFKQSRRREDDIAIVSACFSAELVDEEGGQCVKSVTCAFGGVAPTPAAGSAIAAALTGRVLSSLSGDDVAPSSPSSEELTNRLCAAVEADFPLEPNVPGGMPVFRQTLCASFAVKFLADLQRQVVATASSLTSSSLLSSKHDDAGKSYMDAAATPLTHGTQRFQHNKDGGGLTFSGATRDANGDSMMWMPADSAEGKTRSPVGDPISHRAALLQCTGEAHFTDDIPTTPDSLHAAFVLSTRASGKIKRIDTTQAAAAFGVAGVFTAQDLSETENRLGPAVQDEQLFRSEFVSAMGQPVGLVVAETADAAERAALLVQVEYCDEAEEIAAAQKIYGEEAQESAMMSDAVLAAGRPLSPPAFSIEQASKLKRWKAPVSIVDGDPDEAFAAPDVVIVEGEARIGGQEQFYLETQGALAVPGEGGVELHVHTSAQETRKAQAFAAKACGLPSSHVVAHVKRIGGGFGGKETRAVFVSTAAALAAHRLRRDVRLILDRDVDMIASGGRHPFWAKYKVAAKKDTGKITALDIDIRCNAGYSVELSEPILQRCMFHIDNAYKIPNVRAVGRLCFTNTATNTAFRGFGGPQGMMISEMFVNHVASELKLPPAQVRKTNLYGEAMQTHYNQVLTNMTLRRLWDEIMTRADFEARQKEVAEFNSKSRFIKRGISVIPTKFGINFTAKFMNQGAALVHLYQDGTVLVSHGGNEMGQGLNTKCIQVAARALRVDVDKVHIAECASDKIANAIPTAASAGSDVYGMAILNACEQLNRRLEPYRRAAAEKLNNNSNNKNRDDEVFRLALEMAFFDRCNLSAHGFFKNPTNCGFDFSVPVAPGGSNAIRGTPFGYFTCGTACSEVEVDTLTGDMRILRTDIVMDLGNSLNPAIDIGQIEGAFVQGVGWCMLEEVVWGTGEEHGWLKPGQCFTRGPGSYKIPSSNDVPADFRVTLLDNAPNTGRAVHSSKAVGEPPLFLSASAFFATREAIQAARVQNLGEEEGSKYFVVDSPLGPERIRVACGDAIVETIHKKQVSKGLALNRPSLFC